MTDNALLREQIGNFEQQTRILEETDSLRLEQMHNYELLNTSYSNQIQDLNLRLSKKDKVIWGWRIGCITVGISLALLLILK